VADRLLLDITRLIWRTWRGRHPTGIDRVCLAYLDHFRDRSLAVIQRKGMVFVFTEDRSKKLFDLLLQDRRPSKALLAKSLARAGLTASRRPPQEGMLYLNVGHTGLNDHALLDWIAKHRVRAIHFVHDLIPITNPEFCRPGEAQRHHGRIMNALRSASGIIGNSEFTLDELRSFAVRHSILMPASIAAWIAGLGTGKPVVPKRLDRPHFVTVGTVEARKNHQMLLQVWRRLVAEEGNAAPILLIVGQPGWEAQEALEKLENPGDLEGSVVHLNDCKDDDLLSWIAGARALLMPSFAEGFGLPIVEALAMRTPVIASDLAVFREIAGNIPTYLDPADMNAWHDRARAFAGDGSERERQLSMMSDYRQTEWPEHFTIVESWLAAL
jgi:glycosyltransferase involved in cell wall biosynthesis